MRFVAIVFAVLTCAAAEAATPPLDALFLQLRQAQSPDDAKPIESQIFTQFMQSGSPSVDLLMLRASAALGDNDKDTARKLYDAVTDIAPRYAEGWHRLGLMQSEAGDDERAMLSLQRTLQLNPRQFQAMEQLGEMLEEYGDKPGALKMYRRAEALDPQYEGLKRHIDALSRAVEGQGI